MQNDARQVVGSPVGTLFEPHRLIGAVREFARDNGVIGRLEAAAKTGIAKDQWTAASNVARQISRWLDLPFTADQAHSVPDGMLLIFSPLAAYLMCLRRHVEKFPAPLRDPAAQACAKLRRLVDDLKEILTTTIAGGDIIAAAFASQLAASADLQKDFETLSIALEAAAVCPPGTIAPAHTAVPESIDDDRLWKEARWIKGNSDLKPGGIRSARDRGKQIHARNRTGHRQEYFLPEVIEAFPGAVDGLIEYVSKISSQK